MYFDPRMAHGICTTHSVGVVSPNYNRASKGLRLIPGNLKATHDCSVSLKYVTAKYACSSPQFHSLWSTIRCDACYTCQTCWLRELQRWHKQKHRFPKYPGWPPLTNRRGRPTSEGMQQNSHRLSLRVSWRPSQTCSRRSYPLADMETFDNSLDQAGTQHLCQIDLP